jgi:acyl-CoA thioesterase
MGPVADAFGIEWRLAGEGTATCALAVSERHLNPHGVVHGGVVYTLVDFAMGGALTSMLEVGERCATLEVQIHYLAPVTAGEIRAEARVITRSGRVGVLEARVFAEGTALVAQATGSFYIQRAAPAQTP